MVYSLLRPVLFALIVTSTLIGFAVFIGPALPEGQIVPVVMYNEPVVALVDVDRGLSAVRAHNPNVIFEASLSPDQQEIAYTMSNGERLQVFISNLYEHEARELTDLGEGVTSAVWSPDGRQMALIAAEGSAYNLYLITAPLFNEPGVRLLQAGTYAMPRWSPDGRYLAFTSARMTDLSDIFVLDMTCDADCDEDTYQMTSSLAIDTFPIWSPDGNQMVFLSDRSGDYEIYSLDATCLQPGSVPCRQQNPRRLRLDRLIVPFFLVWSRDGRQLIFRGWDLGINQPGLFAIDPDCYRESAPCPVTLIYDLSHLVMRRWS